MMWPDRRPVPVFRLRSLTPRRLPFFIRQQRRGVGGGRPTLSPIHFFVGVTVCFCVVSLFLVRRLWVMEKAIFDEERERRYFSFGDASANCWVFFDVDSPPRLEPLAAVLPHLRKFGATAVVVQLQNALEDVVSLETAGDAVSWSRVMEEGYDRPDTAQHLEDLFVAALKQNMTVIPVSPDPQATLFYLEKFRTAGANLSHSLTDRWSLSPCESGCAERVFRHFDSFYSFLDAHVRAAGRPRKILLDSRILDQGVACLKACQQQRSSEARRLALSPPLSPSPSLFLVGDVSPSPKSLLRINVAKAKGYNKRGLVPTVNKPHLEERCRMLNIVADVLELKFGVQPIFEAKHMVAGGSDFAQDRLSSFYSACELLEGNGPRKAKILFDLETVEEDSFEAESSIPAKGSPETGGSQFPQAGIKSQFPDQRRPALIGGVTVGMKWTRNWCKIPFADAAELADCLQKMSIGVIDDVLTYRKRMWKARNAVQWSGSLLRLQGSELAMLPFAVEPALAGLGLMRTGMSREAIWEAMSLSQVACNFLYRNPDVARKLLSESYVDAPCEAAFGAETISDLLHLVTQIQLYERECDQKRKKFSFKRVFKAAQGRCDDLRNRACRLRREICRDLRMWHASDATTAWSANVLTVGTMSCPDDDMRLFRDVIAHEDDKEQLS